MVQDSWYWPCSVNPGQPWKVKGSSILWTQNPFKLRKPCHTLLTWEFILTSFWKLLSHVSLLSIIVKGTIPKSWERGLLPAADWQAKKKKKAFLPCLLSLIPASLTCTELLCSEVWSTGRPLYFPHNSFVEWDCGKSWHLHYPGLGIITAHSMRSERRSACIQCFHTAVSVMFTVL